MRNAAAAHDVVIGKWQRIQNELVAKTLVPREAIRRSLEKLLNLRAADTFELQEMTVSPAELAESVAELHLLRAASNAPFDVVVFGYSEPGDDSLPAAYESAGATWWLEYFHDARGPLEASRRRIEAGPS